MIGDAVQTPYSVLKLMISRNGFLWTAHVIPYILIRKVFKDMRLPVLDMRIKRIEKKYNLPGINCAEINKAIWNTWSWDKEGGEEWTWSAEWKSSLISDVLLKYLKFPRFDWGRLACASTKKFKYQIKTITYKN